MKRHPFFIITLSLVLFLYGCSSKHPRDLNIYLDNSSSAWNKYQQPYHDIVAGAVHQMAGDEPHVRIYVFTNAPHIIFDNTVQDESYVWATIKGFIDKNGASKERGTYFIPVITQIQKDCQANPGHDQICLVLSDLEVDDPGTKNSATENPKITASIQALTGVKNVPLCFFGPGSDTAGVRDVWKNIYIKPLAKKAFLGGPQDWATSLEEMYNTL